MSRSTSNKIKRIAICTSGGDGPGMNAAIRCITRYALHHDIQVFGVMRGYQGLIEDDILPLNHRSVSNIISRGGTILKTDRSPEFGTDEGKKRGVEVLKKHKIDAMIVIGGDGSYKGAARLWDKFNFPTIGLPGTIDNDLSGTDLTIGCDTAVNTALESIDKVRDTSHSMERIFVIEVMGNKSGYIAMQVAIGAGAEDVIIPEQKFDYKAMCSSIEAGNRRGKVSWMVIVAEGAAKAPVVAETISTMTGLETRFLVLGHVQRGGTPTARDRILSTRLGAAALDTLLKGDYGKAIGVINGEINVIDLVDVKNRECSNILRYHHLIKILT